MTLRLIISGMILGASPALAAPATQPTDQANVPQPQPSAVAPAATGTVLVLPLADLSGGKSPWVGKALQHDLVAELSRATRSHIQAVGTPAPDTDGALQAGKQAGASVVIYGQYQIVATQMRFTGQVMDVASGKAIGGFTATGDASDLFPLEDAVAAQVLRTLPAGWVTAPLPPATPYLTGPGTDSAGQPLPAPAPAQVAQPPASYYSYTYPDSYSGTAGNPYYYSGYPYYGYPYYGYPYGYYGAGFFFGGFGRFHGGFHDGGHFGGGGFHGGGGGGFHGGGGGGSHGGGGGGHRR